MEIMSCLNPGMKSQFQFMCMMFFTGWCEDRQSRGGTLRQMADDGHIQTRELSMEKQHSRENVNYVKEMELGIVPQTRTQWCGDGSCLDLPLLLDQWTESEGCQRVALWSRQLTSCKIIEQKKPRCNNQS